jgi:hypothetical protein
VTGIDRQRVLAELEPEWLDGLEGAGLEEGRGLLRAVVDDWAQEADSTPDPDAVLRIQREELDARGQGRDADGRLAVLRSRVLERRLDRLDAEAFALGKAVLSGSVGDDEARERGRALLERGEGLAAELDRLGSAEGSPERRKLGEATMDALYAVERKAMSARLARESGGDAPPSILP